MNLDPAGASGFLCAQGARFLLHSSILIAAALLLARPFRWSGLARSAIYRAALLAVILAPVVSFSIERSGPSWAVPLPTAALPATAIMPPPLEPAPMYVSTEAAHAGAADAGPAHVLPRGEGIGSDAETGDDYRRALGGGRLPAGGATADFARRSLENAPPQRAGQRSHPHSHG